MKGEQKKFPTLDEECEHLMKKIWKIEEQIKKNISSDKKSKQQNHPKD